VDAGNYGQRGGTSLMQFPFRCYCPTDSQAKSLYAFFSAIAGLPLIMA